MGIVQQSREHATFKDRELSPQGDISRLENVTAQGCDRGATRTRPGRDLLAILTLLLRRRLLYFSQVLTCAPPVLRGLLAVRRGSVRMPWLRLILNDLKFVWACSPKCTSMPSPEEDPGAWCELIAGFPEQWAGIVRTCARDEFQASTDPESRDSSDTLALSVQCPECRACFASQNALNCHARVVHGVRCVWSKFVLGSSCPVCDKVFSCRLRVFAHLWDRRSGRGLECAAAILAGQIALPCPALPCPALPCLALPCLALPCLALP